MSSERKKCGEFPCHGFSCLWDDFVKDQYQVLEDSQFKEVLEKAKEDCQRLEELKATIDDLGTKKTA